MVAMQNALDKFENAVFNVRPRYVVLASDFREPLRQANEIIASARRESAAELKKVKDLREEAEDVLLKVREAAKREGIQNFAPLFEDLAEENTTESGQWLTSRLLRRSRFSSTTSKKWSATGARAAKPGG